MRAFLCAVFVCSMLVRGLEAREPLAPAPFRGWERAFHLSNDAMEIVVVPEIGRLARLSAPGEENLFRFDEGLAGQVPPKAGVDWLNYGGDWMWPVHQSRWETMGWRVWPPPPLMVSATWRGEAWREADGTGVVSLVKDFGEPLFIQVERRFLLPPGDGNVLRVEQSIRRINASDIPVCLWQISQVQSAEQAFFGLAEDSPFEDGYKHIAFEQPDPEQLERCGEALVYRPMETGEHKLGTDGRWIAARRGAHALIQWAEGGDTGGGFPDGGCAVVMYSNAGLGYTEIETQSVEVDLAPGETFRNTLVYTLLEVEPDSEAREVAERLAGLAPETTLVAFSPEPAHPGDRITVRVRSDEPGGVLHWGVNGPDGGWRLPAEVYWPEGSVVGASGVAVDTPLPDPVDGVSTVELGPFNHPAQVVESLHAVVRWGDRWETRDGENYNLALTPHPDAAAIVWALEDERAVDGEFRVAVATEPEADELRLYHNGLEIAAVEGSALERNVVTDDWNHGPQDLTVRAMRDGHLSIATRRSWKLPVLPEPVDMPADFPYGATLDGEGNAVLHLPAPNARFVEVEWRTGAGARRELMAPTGDGRWTASVALPAGGVLAYRYVVDGEQAFADPWSVDVEWVSPAGRESHLPEHAWSRVGTLPAPLGDWDAPPPETWVIYELSIPDVAPPGSYTGLADRLDYMVELGVNAIEPLPVTAFPGDISWGYNPAFHMALEGSYGTPAEFAALIRAARERGIAFVFDIVLNHVDERGPLNAMHGPPEQNPFTTPFAQFNWGFPKLDQQSDAFKRYVRDTLSHWVLQWGVDGFRYDATQWIKWSGYNDWGAGWMAYVVEQADPDTFQIAENLPGEPDMVAGTELDSEWDAHFRWRMRKVLLETVIEEPAKFREILDPRNHAYQTGWQRVPYIESHDEERFVRELLHAGFGEEEAFRRHLAAAAVTLTVPGVPMLYAGQEWGETTKKVVGPNPLQWDLAAEPARAMMVEAFRELIRLRTGHRALHHDKIGILHLDEKNGTVVYRRPGVPESILVALNVSAHPATLDLRAAGRPVAEVNAAETPTDLGTVALRPGEARVFRVEP